MKKISLPKEVSRILDTLAKRGFDAHVVGGCVRDILAGRKPNDWDIATNAQPEELKKAFPKSFYENRFFTVTVLTGSKEKELSEIEVTTYRTEGKYSDKRRPDEVRTAQTLEEDLSRRDFTMNAIALDKDGGFVDPFGGQEDIEKKSIRTVGSADERFYEDALRMMRAVRLSAQLGFAIEKKTAVAIRKHAPSLKEISAERLRDETRKILASERSSEGFEMLEALGLLEHVLPELREGIGVGQNLHHKYKVWEHSIRCLAWADKKRYPWDVKMAAVLHDVAKPRTKRGEGRTSTFYNHDFVGYKIAKAALKRLKFSGDETAKISTLVRWHMFKYDPEDGITDSAIRRLVRNVGPENMGDLVLVRIADRMGSGTPKAVPYRLRHFQYRVEKIVREEEKPSVKMLKLKGDHLMKDLKVSPGPKIGLILNALLEEVIDDPEKNQRKELLDRARELAKMSDAALKELAKSAQDKVELIESERDQEIKGKHWVK